MNEHPEPAAVGPPVPPPPAARAPAAADQPSDGAAVIVRLNDTIIGDLGHPDVDRTLIERILALDGRVGRWLAKQGIDVDDLRREFGTSPDS